MKLEKGIETVRTNDNSYDNRPEYGLFVVCCTGIVTSAEAGGKVARRVLFLPLAREVLPSKFVAKTNRHNETTRIHIFRNEPSFGTSPMALVDSSCDEAVIRLL